MSVGEWEMEGDTKRDRDTTVRENRVKRSNPCDTTQNKTHNLLNHQLSEKPMTLIREE